MIVDLHKQDFGALTDTICAKKITLAIRAAVFFALALGFMVFFFDFAVFRLPIGRLRAAIPLFLPFCAVIYGLLLLYNMGKRVDLYESGLVYHTLWFELETTYSAITAVHITQECGRDFSRPIDEYSSSIRRLIPLTALTIKLEDGRRWVFYANTYANLKVKGDYLMKIWMKQKTDVG